MINIKPGPELDRLVAEKIMGWRYEIDSGVHLYMYDNGACRLVSDWSPSTDMLNAWEVVKKADLLISNCMIRLENGVLIGNCEVGDGVFGESAPHAICLAALESIGYECSNI